jgi:hypothetical protein
MKCIRSSISCHEAFSERPLMVSMAISFLDIPRN